MVCGVTTVLRRQITTPRPGWRNRFESLRGLLPLYLFVQAAGLLDNVWLPIMLYTSMNLPIPVWMMRSFLAEVRSLH
jgi:hypothetical protein